MAPKSISLKDIKTEIATDISLVAVMTALLSGKWYDNPILERIVLPSLFKRELYKLYMKDF